MSFYIVPEKYVSLPNQPEIDAVVDLLREMLGAIEIDWWKSDESRVVGLLSTGTQTIVCPACGHVQPFENPAAFGEMLFVQSAETVEFDMPCCGKVVNLAQIDLTPNTKFSRFAFEVASDVKLSSNQLQSLENAFKSRLLVVTEEDEE
jgi:hypothetical protein